MKHIRYIISFIVLTLMSCTHNINISYSTYDSDSIQNIDLNHCLENEFYNVSDVLDSVSFVYLETNENSLLGNIRRTIVTDDRIFIRDDYQRTGVAVFDNKGNFLKRLAKGNGPGEINVVRDIHYDRFRHEFLVLSPRKLSKYDIDGNYLESLDIDFPCSSIVGCTEKSYVFSKVYDINTTMPEFSNYSLIVCNKDLETSQLLLPYNKVAAVMITNNSGLEFGHNVIVRKPYSDTIFVFKNDSLFTYKTFDISSKKIDLNQFDSFEDFIENANKGNSQNDIMFDGQYYENSTHIIFGMVAKSTLFPIYINKSNNHSISGLYCKLEFDKDVPIGVPAGVHNNRFFEIANPYTYDFKGIESNRYISKQDLDKLQHLKDDDNPFIMFYKLKDF